MKKIFINMGFFFAGLILFNSCKKSLDDTYFNPEKSETATVQALFTGMLNNDRVAQKYWNVRTFLGTMTGIYTQTAFVSNGRTIYQQNDGYSQQYWDDFYTTGGNGSGSMAVFRTMERVYNSLSPEEQASQQVFMFAGKVALIEQAAKMVDLWGDIPYSTAGSLNSSGIIVKPKYDEQTALYASFIKDLADAATFFKGATSNPQFAKNDILLKGNVAMWRKYANSLRLRLLMHTSMVDETNARTAVMAMLNDPANYPLIDGDMIGAYNPESSDVLLQPMTNNQDNLNSAYTEGVYYAPDFMLNTAMKPNSDPRIPLFFDKFGESVNNVWVPNTSYAAMPITFTSEEQTEQFRKYATIDSGVFLQNIKLPGFVITSSEVNLLKAEAQERWGNSATAKVAYDAALRQSITFYSYCKNVSTVKTSDLVPETVEVDAFVNTSGAAYNLSGSQTDRLHQIYLQKYIHLGFLQSIEGWTELRRTDYPVLTFPSTGKLAGFETPPNRLIYPSGESALNKENWQAVSAKDTRMTKIFWDVR